MTHVLQVSSLLAASFVGLVTTFRFVTRVCFGDLRDEEAQKLKDGLVNYALFKVVVVATVLEPDYVRFGLWTAWFSAVGALKMFAKVANDRCRHVLMNTEHRVSSSSSAISDHVKMGVLGTGVLLFALCAFAFAACTFVFVDGVSTILLMLFEVSMTILQVVDMLSFIALDAVDQYIYEGAWESRNAYAYYRDAIFESTSISLTLMHYIHVWSLNGVSFTLVDAILLLSMRSAFVHLMTRIDSVRSFMTRKRDGFPDATDDELRSSRNDACAICLSKMTTAKKLPCGHCFHGICIHKWLERVDGNRCCPVCREPIEARDRGTSAIARGPIHEAATRDRNSTTEQPGFVREANASFMGLRLRVHASARESVG